MLGPAGALARATVHRVFPRTAFRLIHSRRHHDEIEVKLLPLIVDPERDAVDVGANVGRYASPLSQLALHVHAFEPHPRLCRILRAALPINVTVHQVALSDEEDSALLHVPVVDGREDEGVAHLSPPSERERCITLPIRTTTLDTFELPNVGFLKIDVEGHESRVLAGAQRLIATCKPVVIVESEDRHCPGATEQVRAFFADRDFEGFFVHRGRLQQITAFSQEMQDPQILRDAVAHSSRQSIPYVNNFIFVPRERMPVRFEERGNALLVE